MNIQKQITLRSGEVCELCNSSNNLSIYEVPPAPNDTADKCIQVCETCQTQLNDLSLAEPNHWRCLNDSMWSTIPAVQVVAYRMLHHLKLEGWPQDLLDMLYLDEETSAWAKATLPAEGEEAVVHLDSNGAVLQAGDSVVLIKDLKVKGANFTAKRGTAVRRISLVHDNPEHIEGKVNGQQIVIITKYVKKSN